MSWHQSMSAYSQPSFLQFHFEEKWGMDECKARDNVNTNNDK